MASEPNSRKVTLQEPGTLELVRHDCDAPRVDARDEPGSEEGEEHVLVGVCCVGFGEGDVVEFVYHFLLLLLLLLIIGGLCQKWTQRGEEKSIFSREVLFWILASCICICTVPAIKKEEKSILISAEYT